MTPLRTSLVATAVAATTLGLMTPTFGASRWHPVGGAFTTAPCVFTAYTPDPAAPTTGRFTCASTSQWTGTWTGVSTVTATGSVNLLTGEVTGTADETFVGRASDGTSGTLHVSDVLTVTSDGYLHDIAVILSGTGDWAGAKGEASFDGLNELGPGFGGYSGRWSRAGR